MSTSKGEEAGLETGDRLGPFRLERMLREGAMGVVFKALQAATSAASRQGLRLRPGVRVNFRARRR